MGNEINPAVAVDPRAVYRQDSAGIASTPCRPRLPHAHDSQRRRGSGPLVLCACGCGQLRPARDKHGDLRQFINGHNGRGDKLPPEICARISENSKKFRQENPNHLRGEHNPHWNGGRRREKDGYVGVLRRDHPSANNHRYVPEHRLVMEGILGRYLGPEEIVHHINGDTADNRPGNLMLFENVTQHLDYHRERRHAKAVSL